MSNEFPAFPTSKLTESEMASGWYLCTDPACKPTTNGGRPVLGSHAHCAERWLDKGCKRIATVVDVADGRVSYRYAQGGQNGLWRRGVTPVQTIPLADWLRRFKPER